MCRHITLYKKRDPPHAIEPKKPPKMVTVKLAPPRLQLSL